MINVVMIVIIVDFDPSPFEQDSIRAFEASSSHVGSNKPCSHDGKAAPVFCGWMQPTTEKGNRQY